MLIPLPAAMNDWYLGRILVPIDQVKAKLYNGGGHDSNVYAYYSGVLFASDLQGNFNKRLYLVGSRWTDQAPLKGFMMLC